MLEVVENKEGEKGAGRPRISQMFADETGRTGVEEGGWGASGDGGEKAFKMVAWNYDSVNTLVSD